MQIDLSQKFYPFRSSQKKKSQKFYTKKSDKSDQDYSAVSQLQIEANHMREACQKWGRRGMQR
jgi:hypothetical protein